MHQAHSAPEIIYSAGSRAFLAGFYSESVVTLTAALERGYELFVKVYLLANGKTFSDIDGFWKELRNSSERQLGSFCSIYFHATNVPWEISRKQTEFRNDVTHKGCISTKIEAHKYGAYITAKLNAIISYIKINYKSVFYQYLEASRSVVYRKAEEMKKGNPSIELNFAGSSGIDWNNDGSEQPTFDDLLMATATYMKQFSDGT